MSEQTADDMRPLLSEVRKRGRLSEDEVRSTALTAADKACAMFAPEIPLSNEQRERIGGIFHLIDPRFADQSPDEMAKWLGFIAMIYSNMLYEVLHGQVPYYNPAAFTTFRLGRDEHPITKRGSTLAEYRTVSSGRTYQSVSLPVGHGMYYRIGTSAPKAQQTGLVPVDEGELLISTRAIYFGGQRQTFKIAHSSILRLESFRDGFGVHENYGSGKAFIPYSLGFDDGWFFVNLLSALTAQTAA